MDSVTNDKLTDSNVVAKLFGVGQRRVQQLTQDGIISATKVKGGVYRYDLPLVTQQYIKHLSEKVDGREENKRENDKLDAEIDLKRTMARRAKLDLLELEGSMHHAKDVEAVITDLILIIRNILLALPEQLAANMAKVETSAEASIQIQNKINSILEELSNYRYDPKEYQKRAQEHQGWLRDSLRGGSRASKS